MNMAVLESIPEVSPNLALKPVVAASDAPVLSRVLSEAQQALAASILALVKEAKPLPERKSTSRGTPCARSWDDDWIAKVEASEQRLDRRICGAHTAADTPCELGSNHENGRCRFHGGFALTGAQPGNRNAVIHELYSRRLRQCGVSCPAWGYCPCAGPDLKALPRGQAPTCPYEQAEYNAAVTDALERVSRNPHRDGLDLHLAHNVALLQVMLNRAALNMRNAPLTDDTHVSTETRDVSTPKVSAGLEAFNRITREYRHFAAMIKASEPEEPDLAAYMDHVKRTKADTDLNPEEQARLHPEDAFEGHQQARRYRREYFKQARAGDPNGEAEADAAEAAVRAMSVAPKLMDDPEWRERILEACNPKNARVSPEYVQKLLRYILSADPNHVPSKVDAVLKAVASEEVYGYYMQGPRKK